MGGPDKQGHWWEGGACIHCATTVPTESLCNNPYAWRLKLLKPYGKPYRKYGQCPAGGEHEETHEPTLGLTNNHGECWKCSISPGLRSFNEQCDRNVANGECGICGGPAGHYGECK